MLGMISLKFKLWLFHSIPPPTIKFTECYKNPDFISIRFDTFPPCTSACITSLSVRLAPPHRTWCWLCPSPPPPAPSSSPLPHLSSQSHHHNQLLTILHLLPTEPAQFNDHHHQLLTALHLLQKHMSRLLGRSNWGCFLSISFNFLSHLSPWLLPEWLILFPT